MLPLHSCEDAERNADQRTEAEPAVSGGAKSSVGSARSEAEVMRSNDDAAVGLAQQQPSIPGDRLLCGEGGSEDAMRPEPGRASGTLLSAPHRDPPRPRRGSRRPANRALVTTGLDKRQEPRRADTLDQIPLIDMACAALTTSGA